MATKQTHIATNKKNNAKTIEDRGEPWSRNSALCELCKIFKHLTFAEILSGKKPWVPIVCLPSLRVVHGDGQSRSFIPAAGDIHHEGP